MITAQSVRRCLLLAATVFALLFVALPSFAQQQPWMNSQLSPDVRADLVLKELTSTRRSICYTATACAG